MQSCLVVIAVIHATSIRYRTKINMWVDDFLDFNDQGHLQGQNDQKIPPNAQKTAIFQQNLTNVGGKDWYPCYINQI